MSQYNQNLKFEDHSSLHSYRTEIPNIIWQLGLDPYERDVYSYFKKIAGDRGSCFQSIDTICKNIGIKPTKLREVKKKLSSYFPLIRCSLINVIKRKNHDDVCLPDLIQIVDIWPQNFKLIPSIKSTPPPSPNGGPPLRQTEDPPSLNGGKEDLFKKIPYNKEVYAIQDGDRDSVQLLKRKRKSNKFSHVETSDEEHEKLLKKFGEKLVKEGYEDLLEWKTSKAQISPKDLMKHTDYRRLRKWVIPELLKKQSSGEIKQKMDYINTNKDFFFEYKNNNSNYEEIRKFRISGEWLIISPTKELNLKMNPEAFRDALSRILYEM